MTDFIIGHFLSLIWKKILMFRVLIIFCLLLVSSLSVRAAEYLVVKVADGDTVYLDFNNNRKPDSNERVRLNGIDAFETHNGAHLDAQMKNFGFSLSEVLTLGYLGKKYAEKELLGKFVEARFSAEKPFDNYNRPIMSIIYDGGKSYEVQILKSGLAFVYRGSNLAASLRKYEKIKEIRKNLKFAKNLKLMFYSPANGEFYSIDSEESFDGSNLLVDTNEEKR